MINPRLMQEINSFYFILFLPLLLEYRLIIGFFSIFIIQSLESGISHQSHGVKKWRQDIIFFILF